jgi:hypothetical protein
MCRFLALRIFNDFKRRSSSTGGGGLPHHDELRQMFSKAKIRRTSIWEIHTGTGIKAFRNATILAGEEFDMAE